MPAEEDGVASARRRHHSAVHRPYERAFALVGKLVSSNRSCMSGAVQLARASRAKADKLRFLELARRAEAEHAFAAAREAKDTERRDMRSALQADLRHSCGLVALRCEQWLAPHDARVCLEQLGAIDRRLAAYERAVLERDRAHDRQTAALMADIIKREIGLARCEHEAATLAAGQFHRQGKYQARVAARVVQAAITWSARARNRVLRRQQVEATALMRAAQRETGVLREQLERMMERQRERTAQERARLSSLEAANRREGEAEQQEREEEDAVAALEIGRWQGLAEAAGREAAAADERAAVADQRAIELGRELDLASAEHRRLSCVAEELAAELDVSKRVAEQLRVQAKARAEEAKATAAWRERIEFLGSELEREREGRRVAEQAVAEAEVRMAVLVRASDGGIGGAGGAGGAAEGCCGTDPTGMAATGVADYATGKLPQALLDERNLRHAAEESLREVTLQLIKLQAAASGGVACASLGVGAGHQRQAGDGEAQQPAAPDGMPPQQAGRNPSAMPDPASTPGVPHDPLRVSRALTYSDVPQHSRPATAGDAPSLDQAGVRRTGTPFRGAGAGVGGPASHNAAGGVVSASHVSRGSDGRDHHAAEASVDPRDARRLLEASLGLLEQGVPVPPSELRRLKALYSTAQREARTEQQATVLAAAEVARRELLASSEAAQVQMEKRLSEERARGERESEAMAVRLKQGWARQRERQLEQLTAWRDEVEGVLSSQRVEIQLKSREVSFLSTSLKQALLAMQQQTLFSAASRLTTPRLRPSSAARPGSAARPASAMARAAPPAVQQPPLNVDTGAHELVHVLHEARPRALDDGGGASGGGAPLIRFRGRVHRLVAVPEQAKPRWPVGDAVVDRLLATAPRAPAAHSFSDMTHLEVNLAPASPNKTFVGP
jgi:hypothetical protein